MKEFRLIYCNDDGVTSFDRYFEHIDGLKGAMPDALWEFASDRSRYELDNERSLHDSRLERLDVVNEFDVGSNQISSNKVTLDFLLASNDGLRIVYAGVRSVVYENNPSMWPDKAADLIAHEFTIEDPGLFMHKIEFDRDVWFSVLFSDFRCFRLV